MTGAGGPGPSPAPLEGSPQPGKVRVWDLPTRLFHWLLVALLGFSWWTAEQGELDLHIWSGLAVMALLIFRLLWGAFGSSTARFASFVRGPGAVAGYLAGKWRGIGHNPLGGLSVVAILAAVAVQVGLGLFASDEDGLGEGPLARLSSLEASEQATDLHKQFFDVLLVVVVVHVAAIAFYRLRGRDLLWPMITGRARAEPGVEPMRPARWWAALLCLLGAIAVTRWVIAGAPPFGP